MSATTSRRKTLLASLVGLLWAGGLLTTYWWLEIRYICPFSEQAALFSGDSLCLPVELAGPGPIRLAYFWDPVRPCNVDNQQHLDELIEHLVGKGVGFHVLQKPGSQGRLPDNLAAPHPLADLPGSKQLPVGPAVAIWDRDGCLAYFGPYSEGTVYISNSSSIESIFEALPQGYPVGVTHALTVNCYHP